jgi:hypothetical protein
VLAFAIYLLRGLSLKHGTKKVICVVTSMAFISILASVLRYVFLTSKTRGFSYSRNRDLARLSQIWGWIEVFFGQVAMCLPAFRVLIREEFRQESSRVGGKLFTQSTGPGSGSNSNGNSGLRFAREQAVVKPEEVLMWPRASTGRMIALGNEDMV